MDRKTIIILVVCGLLIVSWNVLMPKIYPPIPVPVATNQVVVSTGGSNGTTATNFAMSTPVAQVIPQTGSSTINPKFVVHSEIPEQFLTISNSEGIYTFTSRGGGLKEVELVGYPETVSSRRKASGTPVKQWATLNSVGVPPVFAMISDESLQGDNVYNLVPIPNGVRAEKSLPNGLAIIKDFQLQTNFLITVSIRLENRSKQALTIPPYEWIAGTATPKDPLDTGLAESVLWYNGSKVETVTLPYFNTNTTTWGIFNHVPKTAYVAGTNNVVWSSSQNQFFTVAAMPEKPAVAVAVHMIDLPPPTAEEIKEFPNTRRDPKGLQTLLMYPGLKLEPGAAATNQFNLFAGPKKYQTLAHLAARFNNEIDQVMAFGWSFTSPISKALLVTMNWVHDSIGLPYGWVIIGITVFIKLVFWPLTKASTRSAKRMQALQPQLKALQEKYKDDPQKFSAKQWEFYKQNKVNPMSGCLPMLIQVPVFIGFYGMLRAAIELRGAPFLWIGDLSNPDTIASIPLPFPLFGLAAIAINPMPLIMGVTLLVQAQLAPMSPSVDPSQQKMMKYMPLMMLVFMYSLPSGLALYWTVSNMLTIVQTKLTRMQDDPPKPVPAGPPQKKKK